MCTDVYTDLKYIFYLDTNWFGINELSRLGCMGVIHSFFSVTIIEKNEFRITWKQTGG